MATKLQLLNLHANQENATARMPGKRAINVAGSKLQPARRPALNDMKNTIGNSIISQNAATKQTNQIMGPPVGVTTKKKIVAGNKENAIQIKKDPKPVAARKILREESILISQANRAAILRREAGKALVNTKSSAIIKEATLVKDTKEKKVEETSLAIQKVEKRVVIPDKTRPEMTIIDPDEKCKKDPTLMTEYVEDILSYVREQEVNYPIQEKFLTDCKISPKMRSTLINWLVDVHNSFHFELETLHQCVSIVDRYLMANKKVERNIFQLVGASALLLASKCEELYIPELHDFVFICDGAFTKKQILQMECDILRKLDFRMGWPMSIYFLRRYSHVAQAKFEQHSLSKYILELALLEYGVAHIRPSLQAAAACCLSIAILTEVMEPSKLWTPTMVHYTSYKYSDFESTVHSFAHILKNAETSKFDSIREKYSHSKFCKISVNFKLEGPLMRKLTTNCKSTCPF